MGILKTFKNRSVRVEWRTKNRYLKMIWWFRRRPIYFLLGMAGIKMAPHQRIGFMTAWLYEFCILQYSRGLAKTFTEALLTLTCLSLYVGFKIQSTAGGSFKQTEQTYDYAEQIVRNEIVGQRGKKYLQRLLPGEMKGRVIKREPSNWQMKLGKSFARGLAIKGEILGFRAHKLAIGEADDIERETMDKVLQPFLNVKYDPMSDSHEEENLFPMFTDMIKRQNSLLLTGTVSYDWSYYYNLLKTYLRKIEDGSKKHGVAIFDFEDTYIGEQNFENPVIKKQYIKMDITSILEAYNNDLADRTMWKSQNKNIVMSSEGKEFPSSLIFDANRDKVGERVAIYPLEFSDEMTVIGIDPARSGKGAEFAMQTQVVRDTYTFLANTIALKGASFPTMTLAVTNQIKLFPNTVIICMDSGGGGRAIEDNLRNKMFCDPPIIDPANPENLALMSSGEPYRPILRMLLPTAERNTIWNNFTKSQLQMRQLLIPETLSGKFICDFDMLPKQYLDNKGHILQKYQQMYKDILITKNQITNVEIERAGNFFSYFVPEGLKDRYSAYIYSGAALQIYKIEGVKEVDSGAVGGSWV